MKITTHKITILGLCTAAAMILSYVESFIPYGIYGVKMGLPNIVIIYILYRMGTSSAIAVSIIRVLLVSILFGNIMSLWYSLAGAALSLLIMRLLMLSKLFSPVAVSVAGGISHNIGQICVAILVTGVAQIGFYLPILAVSGIISGILIGIAGALVLKRF